MRLYARLPHRALYFTAAGRGDPNSYAALSLMVAVQSHIAGRPIPAEAK